jgi:antitoxin (DNA-binding transcriptional repressor) of toxin-antitoxin stability system
MDTISIRELKANPARAIDLTRQGKWVQVTSHRKPVAQLVPLDVEPATPKVPVKAVLSDDEVMRRLIDSGFVEPASKPFKLGKTIRIPPGPNGQTMSDLVLEMRGPR